MRAVLEERGVARVGRERHDARVLEPQREEHERQRLRSGHIAVEQKSMAGVPLCAVPGGVPSYVFGRSGVARVRGGGRHQMWQAPGVRSALRRP